MDEVYYPKKTLEKFINTMIGMGKSKSTSKNIEQVVYVLVTNILRDIIFDIIGKITVHMNNWGDIIVTGGEAFNNYFDVDDRVISSDIDTKFVPIFIDTNGKNITPFDKKFFGYLQYAKLDMWNFLGKIAKEYTPIIKERIKELSKIKLGKYLQISSPQNVTRRYIVIKKSVRDRVLIDVELFALDIKLKYYCPVEKKPKVKNLGGILDIAMMRPFEIGYEIAFTRDRGIVYRNPISNMIRYNKNILIASKKFLIEDLYIMKKLGLRPNKAKKDKTRMVTFAKNILKIKNISSQTPDEKILKLSLKHFRTDLPIDIRKRKKITRDLIKQISNIKPRLYENYTTTPSMEKVLTIHRPGLINNSKLTSYKTNSEYYFNKNARNWRLSKNPFYVRNRFQYRNKNPNIKNQNIIPYENTLYSYYPKRNNWVPRKIIRKSAMIPYTGLKNSNLKKLVK